MKPSRWPVKTILLEFIGRKHSLYDGILGNPPPGYRIVENTTVKTSIARFRMGEGTMIADTVHSGLSRVFPLNLFYGLSSPLVSGTPHDLLYASGHVVWRDEPWITDLEMASHLTGYSISHLSRFRGIVKSRLLNGHCRGALTWTRAARDSLCLNLDNQSIDEKTAVMPLPITSKVRRQREARDVKRVLFVGSSNFPLDFHYKGGKEAIEAFRKVSEERDDVEFVMRCKVPSQNLSNASKVRNLSLIQKTIPRTELAHLFETSDIFVLPAHHTPALVLLEAMSYGLPIVCTDVWANREMVIDGRNGTVIATQEGFTYEDEFRNPLWSEKVMARRILSTTCQDVVRQLVESLHRLLDDNTLRKRMGAEGYSMISQGQFSIPRRNKLFSKFLDDAL